MWTCLSTSLLQQVAKIVETLHLLGALLIYLLSHTLQPPLSVLLARQINCCKPKQSTLKGGEGKGCGKGLNSRYGGYWKLEKVFFDQSVSTILQLVVAEVSFLFSFAEPDGYGKSVMSRNSL